MGKQPRPHRHRGTTQISKETQPRPHTHGDHADFRGWRLLLVSVVSNFPGPCVFLGAFCFSPGRQCCRVMLPPDVALQVLHGRTLGCVSHTLIRRCLVSGVPGGRKESTNVPRLALLCAPHASQNTDQAPSHQGSRKCREDGGMSSANSRRMRNV